MDENREKWFLIIDSKILDYNRAICRLLKQRDSRVEFEKWLKDKK